MAFALHLCEHPPELSHFVGKPGRHVLATRPSLPVLRGAVHPPPHRPAADRADAACQTVRAGARQTVEHGVVRGADGAAQIRPPWPAGVGLREVGGYLQEVLRRHDALLRLFPDLRFGDERDDGKRLHVRALKFGAQAVLQSNPRQGVGEAPGVVAVIVGESYQEEIVAVAVHFRVHRQHAERGIRALPVQEAFHGAPRPFQNLLFHRSVACPRWCGQRGDSTLSPARAGAAPRSVEARLGVDAGAVE